MRRPIYKHHSPFYIRHPGNTLGADYDVNENGCHIWKWATHKGYPVCTIDGERQYIHRRVIREQLCAEKPQANHACGNKRCINSDHIYAGTQAENNRDRVIHGTSNKGKKYPQGTRIKTQGSNHHGAQLDEGKVRYKDSTESRTRSKINSRSLRS